MSVQISTYVVTTGVRSVEYAPARIHQGGTDSAQVRVRFAGYVASLDLDIEDAEALLHGVAVALVEHAVAQHDSAVYPKAVA